MTDSLIPRLRPQPMNRREFLFYVWGASGLVLAAASCAGIAWLAIPRPSNVSHEQIVTLLPSQIPPQDAPVPQEYPVEGSRIGLWLTNTQQGLFAFAVTCTREGCLFKWNPLGAPGHEFPHFVCPCCGSQFTNEGVYVAGVAGRNLDSYVITVTTPNGTINTPKDGGPVPIDGATQIVVDTHIVILGKARAGTNQMVQNLNSRHTFGP